MCSNNTPCGYCPCHHGTSDHKFNVVGCMAKPGLLCGHTLEMHSDCMGTHIVLTNSCAKKSEAARAGQQSRPIQQRASTNAATDVASVTNTVFPDPRPNRAAEKSGGGGSEAKMAYVGGKEATWEADDNMMTETAITTATDTGIGAETETRDVVTNK